MSERVGFRKKLQERQEKANSLVCVGLDPLIEKMPDIIRKSYPTDWRRVLRWMTEIVDATADHASLFKPQSAHWESFEGGRQALQALIDHIHNEHPDIPIFLDCKRGDIARTQQRYRIAHFELDGVDGMNFSPYMGADCMKELVDKTNPGTAIVGLCYTSNPSARQVQDVILQDGRRYWEFIAECTLEWAADFDVLADAGLVMAAAHPLSKKEPEKIVSEHLVKGRKIVDDDLWFLIPGIGTQGGFVEETTRTAYQGPGSIAVNSSSGIIFAGSDSKFTQAAEDKAMELKEQIIDAMP